MVFWFVHAAHVCDVTVIVRSDTSVDALDQETCDIYDIYDIYDKQDKTVLISFVPLAYLSRASYILTVRSQDREWDRHGREVRNMGQGKQLLFKARV